MPRFLEGLRKPTGEFQRCPWIVVKERKSGFYPDVEVEAFLKQHVERPGESPRPRFIEREGIKSMAALLLPFRAAEVETEEVVGVMFASYRARHQFDIEEITALATFADYAAVAILNARVEEQHYTEQMRMVESMAANFAHRMGNLGGACNLVADTLASRVRPDDQEGTRALGHMRQRAQVLLGKPCGASGPGSVVRQRPLVPALLLGNCLSPGYTGTRLLRLRPVHATRGRLFYSGRSPRLHVLEGV